MGGGGRSSVLEHPRCPGGGTQGPPSPAPGAASGPQRLSTRKIFLISHSLRRPPASSHSRDLGSRRKQLLSPAGGERGTQERGFWSVEGASQCQEGVLWEARSGRIVLGLQELGGRHSQTGCASGQPPTENPRVGAGVSDPPAQPQSEDGSWGQRQRTPEGAGGPFPEAGEAGSLGWREAVLSPSCPLPEALRPGLGGWGHCVNTTAQEACL